MSNRSRDHFRASDQVDQVDQSELAALRAEVAALERELQDTQLQALAYSQMITLAEQTFKIKIRKKSNTKPSNG